MLTAPPQAPLSLWSLSRPVCLSSPVSSPDSPRPLVPEVALLPQHSAVIHELTVCAFTALLLS